MRIIFSLLQLIVVLMTSRKSKSLTSYDSSTLELSVLYFTQFAKHYYSISDYEMLGNGS
jgi:hypothetical protein